MKDSFTDSNPSITFAPYRVKTSKDLCPICEFSVNEEFGVFYFPGKVCFGCGYLDKIKGLSFQEAIELLMAGTPMRRKEHFVVYGINYISIINKDDAPELYVKFNNGSHYYSPNLEDILANDWEVVDMLLL